MYRIDMKIVNSSPLMGFVNGEILIIKSNTLKQKEIIRFNISKRDGGTRYYSEPSGIPSKVFRQFRPIVDIMIRCYFDGLKMNDQSFIWIDGLAESPTANFIVKVKDNYKSPIPYKEIWDENSEITEKVLNDINVVYPESE
jgi:hypothetical protein